ncbi:hypothetical protein HPB48_002050 [Haemaphysalis longicornis]|uniref:Acyl-CoA synthetase n=1 Tax=Haemaphysalis longicornis TaxID=44386 RepID=A0A9J6FI16_HAELO|nr:hypothetical protein HPB48_002050 [Haemaphysalis longicornis]
MTLTNSPLAGKYNLTSWTSAGLGGGVVPASVIEDFKQKFKLENLYFGYSMTELTGFMTMPTTNPNSIGAPFPMTEVKVSILKDRSQQVAKGSVYHSSPQIIDIETKEALGPNEDGEICARGPQVMKGYINNKEATDKTIDADGWLHTGDVGHFDEDGNVCVVERVKDLIRCLDVHVVPAELEQLLLSHPAVAEALVVGLPHPQLGEAPRAFVVLSQGVCADDALTHELLLHVSEQVEHAMQLHGGLEFVPTLPKSPTGQYLRRELRSNYLHKQHAV